MVGETPEDLAKEYLSKQGFDTIVSNAAVAVTNIYQIRGKDILHEYAFQDHLFLESMFRFPPNEIPYESRKYMLLKEVISG